MVRLDVKGNQREYRMASTGFTGTRGGTEESKLVPIELKPVDSGAFYARIDNLEAGEYAWFLGGVGGRAFTFRVSK
jgi:hypothetical protein